MGLRCGVCSAQVGHIPDGIIVMVRDLDRGSWDEVDGVVHVTGEYYQENDNYLSNRQRNQIWGFCDDAKSTCRL